MSLPDRHLEHPAPDTMHAAAGLTAVDIAAMATQATGVRARV